MNEKIVEIVEKNLHFCYFDIQKAIFAILYVAKLYLRLGIYLSVASQGSEIEEAALLSTLNAKLVAYLRFTRIIYRYRANHFVVKG